MKILLTNITLATRTGTEIVVRDLALAFAALGHEPVVYTPQMGCVADEILAAGVPVVSDLDEIQEAPDVIHGHHHVQTMLAMLRFPSAPTIFVCHDRFIWHDLAPSSDQIRRYVAVDRNCMERLQTEAEIPASRIRLVHNAVDTNRFFNRSPLPKQPSRALVFSNYAGRGTHLEPVLEACAMLHIPVDTVGAGVGAQSDRPEHVLPQYDLVFAKARCALEAMAAGNAVILCDTRGLGPMVTMKNVETLRDWNFGMRCLQQRLNSGAIAEAIRSYDAEQAGAVSCWIRRNANLDAAAQMYLDLYAEAIEEARIRPVNVRLDSLLTDTVRRAGALESRIRTASLFSTSPLPEEAVHHVCVRAVDSVRNMRADSTFQILVEIRNASNETLASVEPAPVRLSYHWIDPVSGETVIVDGERTALTCDVGPRCVHRQMQTVVTPSQPGRWILRLTLVQESVRWFEAVHSAAATDLSIDIANSENQTGVPFLFDLNQAARWIPQLAVIRNAPFSNLGFVSNSSHRMLTFANSARFVREMLDRPGIACVITTPDLAAMLPENLGVAVSDDPYTAFVHVHNYLASQTSFYWEDFPALIDPTAQVHPATHIPSLNVVIGARASIGPNVTVGERVFVAADSVVHAGAVLGAEGFQSNRSGPMPEDMIHAGAVRIGENAKIYSNAIIARGVFREFTEIGQGSRIGNAAFISHNVQVGGRSFIGHGAVVNGNGVIGEGAWIGPNATIANSLTIGRDSHVSLGATVIRDVADGTRVIGSVAGDTRKMLRSFKTTGGNRS